MKRIERSSRGKLVLMATACMFLAHIANAQTRLPKDVDTRGAYCPLSAEFKKWIMSRNTASAPNNLSFDPGERDCPFYERAEQMFLWLTSPIRSKYEQVSYIFNSPMFYIAWSADASARSLAPMNTLAPIGRDEISGSRTVLDARIDIEPGEADQDATVLMTRNRRLVYYLVEVNDVYAFFLTGKKTNEIKAASFPAEQKELDDIQKFAHDHNKELAAPKTLAIELKSAWIEADSLKQSEIRNYLTIDARIPIYGPAQSAPTKTWVLKETKVKKLALVGMHVVFGVRGHPEMVWATFEHVSNTPNPSYEYFARGSAGSKTQPADAAGGNWLLSANGSGERPNEAKMHFNNAREIVAYKGKTVGPSNILRKNPWGSDNAPVNTKIVSVNKQVHDRLLPADVRRNYIMIGATWAQEKTRPLGHRNQAGSTRLVNTTMETFHNKGISSCFECHTGNMLGDERKKSGLSHIFGVLPPLKLP